MHDRNPTSRPKFQPWHPWLNPTKHAEDDQEVARQSAGLAEVVQSKMNLVLKRKRLPEVCCVCQRPHLPWSAHLCRYCLACFVLSNLSKCHIHSPAWHSEQCPKICKMPMWLQRGVNRQRHLNCWQTSLTVRLDSIDGLYFTWSSLRLRARGERQCWLCFPRRRGWIGVAVFRWYRRATRVAAEQGSRAIGIEAITRCTQILSAADWAWSLHPYTSLISDSSSGPVR